MINVVARYFISGHLLKVIISVIFLSACGTETNDRAVHIKVLTTALGQEGEKLPRDIIGLWNSIDVDTKEITPSVELIRIDTTGEIRLPAFTSGVIDRFIPPEQSVKLHKEKDQLEKMLINANFSTKTPSDFKLANEYITNLGYPKDNVFYLKSMITGQTNFENVPSLLDSLKKKISQNPELEQKYAIVYNLIEPKTINVDIFIAGLGKEKEAIPQDFLELWTKLKAITPLVKLSRIDFPTDRKIIQPEILDASSTIWADIATNKASNFSLTKQRLMSLSDNNTFYLNSTTSTGQNFEKISEFLESLKNSINLIKERHQQYFVVYGVREPEKKPSPVPVSEQPHVIVPPKPSIKPIHGNGDKKNESKPPHKKPKPDDKPKPPIESHHVEQHPSEPDAEYSKAKKEFDELNRANRQSEQELAQSILKK